MRRFFLYNRKMISGFGFHKSLAVAFGNGENIDVGVNNGISFEAVF